MNDESEMTFYYNGQHYALYKDSFNSLVEGHYLNDIIVEFFVKWMIGKDKNVYVMNSHCLNACAQGKFIRDLTDCELIFSTIFGDNHWSLLVYFHPNREDGFVAHFDSLHIHNTDWAENKVNAFLQKHTTLKNLRTQRKCFHFSKQTNNTDCGVFVCLYGIKIYELYKKWVFSQLLPNSDHC